MPGGPRNPMSRFHNDPAFESQRRAAQLRNTATNESTSKRVRSALVGILCGLGIIVVGGIVTFWTYWVGLGWFFWGGGLAIVGLGISVLIFMGSDESKNKGYRF